MATHLKYFFFLLCASTIVADSTQLESSHKSKASSYYPRPQDFPNERLYNAYFVIQRFKNTISCDPRSIITTWNGPDICGEKNYRGFYCTAPTGHGDNLTVTSIVFDGFGLCAPKLQGFIDQLPDLALFQASSNKLSSDIPRLNDLPYLYSLNVESILDSSMYKPLFGDPHCVYAALDSIRLKKPICVMYYPSGIQKTEETTGATNAQALLLNSNSLSGPLPANIGLSKVSYLALANNKLTGPIPPSISHLQDSLLEVLLLNNQLSGCLPHELGMLTKTSVIDAGMNKLTGPIPASFSCLSSVEQLNLAGNRLYGQVPEALCNLAGPAGRLANLTLSSNYFTSVGPACSALIKDGVLGVKRNCIPGFANQRAPAECASFLSQPKTCPAASAPVACPAAADAKKNVAAPEGRVARDYSSYVIYATLHE
uniref:Uncharacterized protein n=1 Tax=Avena sativa TaxID=4498 RepID=A0ACD5ZC65_AVESA